VWWYAALAVFAYAIHDIRKMHAVFFGNSLRTSACLVLVIAAIVVVVIMVVKNVLAKIETYLQTSAQRLP
jgi:hypothetical protein